MRNGFLIVLPALLLSACGDPGAPSTGRDDEGLAGASAGGGAARGEWAVGALPYDVVPGEAIEAANQQWTFIGFPDSRCANGTATGIAINPVAEPRGVLVFMQGGGACWDAETCLVTKASVHLEDEVGEATVLAEAGGLSGLFDHDNALPWVLEYAADDPAWDHAGP